MTSSAILDNAVLFRAECRRVRERAQTIVAEARMLREQLDQTGGLLSCALQAHGLRTDWVPLAAAEAAPRQPSRAAA